jgi:DNA-binding response OmpR family regulator
MLVDKDPISADSIGYYLESAGYTVDAVYDPRAALGELAHRRPELLIVEVILTGMSGLSFCEMVRRNPDTAGIPIIVMSVLAAGDRALACADDYLLKPVDRGGLLASVRGLLARVGGRGHE